MAYGELRLLYNTLITSHAMLTTSSHANGSVSGASKIGDGVAILTISGSFAGNFDLLYTLEIDSVTAGAEVGQATFRWRTSDTASGAWEETGVVTRTTPAYALSADGLGGGLSVAHTGKTGVDFAVGDVWQWNCRASYGSERILDRDRMTKWRSTGITTENIVIDLGSAQNATALVIHDHNFTDAASVKLQENATDAWGAPSYDSGDITIQDPLFLYFDQTYRYHRILMADATNTDGYLEFANLFDGTYTTFDQVNAWWGSAQSDGYVLQQNQSEAGVRRRYAYAKQRKLSLDFGNTVSNDDIDLFITIQEALINLTTHRVSPLWIHLFNDEPDKLNLMEWDNLEEWSHEYFRYLLSSGVTLEASEVVKI